MKYILLGWCCAVGLFLGSASAQAISVSELQAQVDALLAQLSAMQATSTATTQFVPGTRVETTDTIRVRSYYGLLGSLIGLQGAGVSGVIGTGPFSSDGYRWVKVDFAAGTDGWVTTSWLQTATDGATTTVATSTITTPVSTSTAPITTTWNISQVKEVALKAVDPIPGAIDDEYTEYQISLTDGTVRVVAFNPFYSRTMQEEVFAKSGFVGDIEKLLALADRAELTTEGISEVVVKGLTVTLLATVSQDTSRLATVCGPTSFGTMAWSDGKTETVYGLGCSATTQEISLTHTYAKAGTYTIVLTDAAKNRTETKVVVSN